MRREGRAVKHEGNGSTNRCIKGYRRAFVESTWHRIKILPCIRHHQKKRRGARLTGDNMIQEKNQEQG
jgi:hypothetical protein